MKKLSFVIFIVASVVVLTLSATSKSKNNMTKTIYNIKVKTNEGKEIALSEYKNKVLLIVNTASECGYTPQYTGLEELYKKYAKQGFEVLAFPCNQFGSQEPGTNAQIKDFCESFYKVTFPIFDKIEVNGENSIELYKFLKSDAVGLGTEDIKWNFTKFLVNRDGVPVKRYASAITPEAIDKDIKELLK